MKERVACEFRLIQYVPDVARGEFVYIGVMLREVSAAEMVMLRFARGWTRVRSLDVDADVAMLAALEGELRERLTEGDVDERPLMEVLEASFSNQVQVTPWRASLAETMPAEMDRLMGLYVDSAPRTMRAREGRRALLVTAMRQAFEGAGVWVLMRKEIRAAEYTAAGDPLRIDCGYRPNGTIRMFQAVALRGDLDGAKVLALAARDLVAGVRAKEGAALELTAIVPPLRGIDEAVEEREQYRFAVTLMEREAIRVMTTGDLGRIAETAARELGV
jgi:hypothetical protein